MIQRRSICLRMTLVLITSFLSACVTPVRRLSTCSGITGNGSRHRSLPATAMEGTAGRPVFGIGIHVEPFGASTSALVPGNPPGNAKQNPDYAKLRDFQEGVLQITQQVGIINAAGGVATIQLQSPFTTTAIQTGSAILSDLAAAGNELALHFHEDAHLGRVRRSSRWRPGARSCGRRSPISNRRRLCRISVTGAVATCTRM